MSQKTSKPAAMGAGRLRNVNASTADDNPKNSPLSLKVQARIAVNEMIANGAKFTVPHRTDGLASFLYALPRGGDIQRCRSIIRDAKATGFYDLMVGEIIDLAKAS